MLRSQYHLRQSDRGLLAWDVRRLADLARELPAAEIPLTEIKELDECHWYEQGGGPPTCRSVARHCALIQGADPVVSQRPSEENELLRVLRRL